MWLALVTATNVMDGLKALGVLRDSWPFASGNYAFMVQVTGVYGTPVWLIAVLFTGVVLWEGLAALLFLRAAWLFREARGPGMRVAITAFTVSLALWAGFMFADEIFVSYPVENTHRGIFTAELASLLAIGLLPDQ